MACQAALDTALRCPLPGPPCCPCAARGARAYGATTSAAAIGIAHAASGQVQNGVRRAATVVAWAPLMAAAVATDAHGRRYCAMPVWLDPPPAPGP